MDYLVVGPDGQEYGPANVDTLRSWAAENRLLPTTTLKDFQTGQLRAASSVPGIFPPQSGPPPSVSQSGAPMPPAGNWSQPPSNYARPGQIGVPYRQDSGNMDIAWALVRCAIAIVLLFVFSYAGLITAIYAVMWAFRAKSKGHRHAPTVIGITIAVLIFVVIVFIFRMSNGAGRFGSSTGGY